MRVVCGFGAMQVKVQAGRFVMRTKADIVLLVLVVCVAVAGLVHGDDSDEGNIGLTGLVIGIVIWVAMLVDHDRSERTPGLPVTPFRRYAEFMLAVNLVLEFTILVILFGSILALVLVIVDGETLLTVVCSMAVMALARVAMPQTRACISSICVIYGRSEQV